MNGIQAEEMKFHSVVEEILNSNNEIKEILIEAYQLLNTVAPIRGETDLSEREAKSSEENNTLYHKILYAHSKAYSNRQMARDLLERLNYWFRE